MISYPAQALTDPRSRETLEGVRIGKIVDTDDKGIVYVDFKGNTRGPLAAKLTGAMRDRLENQGWTAFSQVLLLFEEEDSALPVVIDVVVAAVKPALGQEALAFQMEKNNDMTIDGKTITFDAQEQIVLKCGKASITLTKAGKVIIRGAYVLNRSSGVNRIKGGSVQIN